MNKKQASIKQDYDSYVKTLYITTDIRVSACNNATSTTVCASPEEIQQYRDRYMIGYTFTQSYIDFEDYENPIKSRLRMENTPLS